MGHAAGTERRARARRRWTVVAVVAAAVLACAVAALGALWLSYHQGQQRNAELAELAGMSGAAGDAPPASLDVDWDALLAANPDTVAWVYVPGTAINNPVVQGDDNEHYLLYDFDGSQGWLADFGTVFMDWRNDPDWADQAYFIYGHHMSDGSMFAGIDAMKDQARFDASRTVYLLSPSGGFKLRTFSLVHCAADDPLVQIGFDTPGDMAAYVQDKIDRSVVDVGEVPPAGDIRKLFAFATCDSASAGRYVLYAYVEEADVEDLSGDVGIARDGGDAAGFIADLEQR